MDDKLIKWNKILDFFGLQEENNNPPENKNISRKKDKVVSINRKQKYKVLFYNPESFEAAKNIVDNLKDRNAVIVNLEDNERKLSQRILDFISGAIYGLNGNTQKIGKEVFIFTPSNIKIDGQELQNNIRDELLSK